MIDPAAQQKSLEDLRARATPSAAASSARLDSAARFSSAMQSQRERAPAVQARQALMQTKVGTLEERRARAKVRMEQQNSLTLLRDRPGFSSYKDAAASETMARRLANPTQKLNGLQFAQNMQRIEGELLNADSVKQQEQENAYLADRDAKQKLYEENVKMRLSPVWRPNTPTRPGGAQPLSALRGI